MSFLGDADEIACEIEDAGNTISVEYIHSSTFNKYGDATDTVGEFKDLKAVCNFLSFEDRMVQEGLYRSGDMIFYIAVNEETSDILKQRNKIIYNLQKFEIMEILPHAHTDTSFIYEVRAKRI